MNLNLINKICISQMKYKSSHPYKEKGNKYYHGQRTSKIIERLCSTIGYEENTDILIVSAWFHDICNGSDNHELLGAEKTCTLLKEICSENELSMIRTLISTHDSRTKTNLSIESKILQDADLLDHFGVFEIWCTFGYAIKESLSMSETCELMINNYNQEYDQERKLLHFEISKRIYDEKRQYVFEFIKRMHSESTGEIIDIDIMNRR